MNRMMLSGLLATTTLVCCGKPFVFDTSTSSGAGGSGGDTTASSSNSGGMGSSGSGGEVPDAGQDVQCRSLTCEDFGYNCGSADDGCGGMIFCGQCAAPDICGVGNPGEPNICGESPCATELVNPGGSPAPLSGVPIMEYNAVVDCVCHTGQTTNACGFDQASKDMCAKEEVTWDFLANDPIGPCVASVCAVQILACENNGAP